MKKISIILLSLLLITGCNKNNINENKTTIESTTSTTNKETTTTECTTQVNDECHKVGDVITVGAKVTGSEISKTILLFYIPDGLELVDNTQDKRIDNINIDVNPVRIEYVWNSGNKTDASKGISVHPLKYKITKEGKYTITLRTEASGYASIIIK